MRERLFWVSLFICIAHRKTLLLYSSFQPLLWHFHVLREVSASHWTQLPCASVPWWCPRLAGRWSLWCLVSWTSFLCFEWGDSWCGWRGNHGACSWFWLLDIGIFWVVVSNIFYFHPYLGNIPILTDIFQMGWNHQPYVCRWWALQWFPQQPIRSQPFTLWMRPIVQAFHLVVRMISHAGFCRCRKHQGGNPMHCLFLEVSTVHPRKTKKMVHISTHKGLHSVGEETIPMNHDLGFKHPKRCRISATSSSEID